MTRVLVVEDEESFSDALSYMLRREGFEVAVCPTGPDAIEAFDRNGARTAQISVADQGIGIPESQRDRIFEKFYRVDDDVTGTGLGLFIARGLVSAMGGRIHVDSEEGHGSRFAFELPMVGEE